VPAATAPRKISPVETISNRLNVYNDQTAPLVGFYKEEGLLLSVKATSSQSVIDAIQAKIG
jgi:adenylate kinase